MQRQFPQLSISTEQEILERLPEVFVEERVDARVDPRRQVTQPGEDLKEHRRNLAEFDAVSSIDAAQAVGEIGAEEGQPEDHKRGEHPDEGLLRPPFPAADPDLAAGGQHVDVDHRPRPRPSQVFRHDVDGAEVRMFARWRKAAAAAAHSQGVVGRRRIIQRRFAVD